MKKIIIHILIFVSPVWVTLVYLPVEKRIKYTGLKDDCFNHGIWIHDRIFVNQESVDIAFLGSSHMINGIDDKLISNKLKTENAVNFGYCRLGRNLHYVLLKEIAENKDINKLVLEVREGEERYSHPVFPCLASGKDIFLPNLFFNSRIFSDIWKHLSYKVEMFQNIIYRTTPDIPIQNGNWGFASHSDTANVEFLDNIKLKRCASLKKMSKIQQRFDYSFARGYVKKIAAICKRRNIEIYYLFMPSYGTPYKLPKEYTTYKKFGTVLIPPEEIYLNKDYWWDENHLNIAGASNLSKWVAEELDK